MKNQAYNPYLPLWEYVPDGEPHVFGDRIYVYGSHDLAHGCVFCLGDYVCWSAPVTDLSDWKYEGIIYSRMEDPANKDGRMVLYAPDVTQGPDKRFYLYYVYDKVNFVSVAVSDSPKGPFKFHGYVHYKSGERLGERKGDQVQFDPAVLTENGKTYMYTAFCGHDMKDRIGAMATVLASDMLTIEEEPALIVPGDCYSEKSGNVPQALKDLSCPYKVSSIENWSAYKGHEFFEASSIRKIGNKYYFIYSSVVMHELCYATSSSPTEGFVYGGVIVSNCDLHIGTYKPAETPAAYGANNHGGIEKINGEWYIFYHRHTNGTWFSRQGCAEKIRVLEDGSIPQVEITSCGLNGGPLEGKGEYPAAIACNLFTEKPSIYVAEGNPKVSQDGCDKEDGTPFEQKDTSYITGIIPGTTIGFKYFDFKNLKRIGLRTRAYIHGNFEIRTSPDGPSLGTITVDSSNFWETRFTDIKIPDGKSALYLKFTGTGTGQLKSIILE